MKNLIRQTFLIFFGLWAGLLFAPSVSGEDKPMFPNGRLQAIWCAPPDETDEAAGLAKIDEMLERVASGGFNALFLWGTSDYLWAVTEGGDELKESPTAFYDPFGKMIERGKALGIAVHLWYSPWIYKSSYRSIEQRRHPDWAPVNIEGTVDTDGICLNRPEVRQFELDLLRKVIRKYPDLAGIHIEEPGYNWGEYCYCGRCRAMFETLTGEPVGDDLEKVREQMRSFNAAFSTDFMIRLGAMIDEENPNLLFSTNGCAGQNTDWKLGRDWTSWSMRKYIDFYVPQIYTKDVEAFKKGAIQTKKRLGDCAMVPGFAISWSGIYPERLSKETLEGLVAAALAAEGQGYVVFHYNHFEPVHFETFNALNQRAQSTESVEVQ